MVSSVRPGPSHARISCFSCRQGKRRCDRTLPTCTLCSRKQTSCTYPTRRGERAASSADHADAEPAGRSNSKPTDSGTPSGTSDNRSLTPPPPTSTFSAAAAVSFLAPQVFRQAQLEMPRAEARIPSAVAAYVGDAAAVRGVAGRFFATTHRWLPVVSKRRFFTSLMSPLSPRRCELSLLALCMRLSTSAPPREGEPDVLYRTAKRFLSDVEGAGVLSVHVLQAAVLIALYEMGQAVYPAAYLSVGWCARYGAALGADRLMADLTGRGGDGDGAGEERRTWLEIEETRRTWWGVLIIDRLMNINHPERPLSAEDARFDSYLPVDDGAFDDGTTKPEDAVNLSTGFALKMGLFARLCQAIYLLGQALKTVSSSLPRKDENAPSPSGDETAQLRRTLLALVNLADREAKVRNLEFCSQSAVCYNAIMLLQEHCFPKPTPGSFASLSLESSDRLFPEARSALGALYKMAISFNQDCIDTPEIMGSVSVFLTQMVYQTGSTLIRLGGENADTQTREQIGIHKELLRRLSSRWRVAGIFLSILEAQEVTMATLGF